MALCCHITSKILIVIIAILFWIVSGALVFLSIWLFTENAKFSHLSDLADSSLFPAYVLLVAAFFLFMLGLVGCIGALKHKKCLIGFYFTFMLLALIGLASGVVLAYIYRNKIDNELHSVMKESLNKYNSSVKTAVDEMQQELHCCGVDNYTDWFDAPLHRYPESCCVNKTCNGTDPFDPNVYKKGCYVEIREEFMRHILAIYGVVAACAFLLLVGMISACFLMRTRQPDNFIYRALSDTEGMRV